MQKEETMTLTGIVAGSDYELSHFKEQHKSALEARITMHGQQPYAICLARQKEVRLTPEEVVRQLFLEELTADFGYPLSRIAVEHEVTFGREKKRADIVVFDKQRSESPYIIVELKKPKLKV